MQRFGKETVVKLAGGELIYRMPYDAVSQLIVRIQGTATRAVNLREPFERFRPRWQQLIRENFVRQGIPVPWPALSPAYAEWKRRHFPGKTILRRTDRLMNSLTTVNADTIWQTTPRTIRFGTRVPWFRFHQEGTKKMPARPPLILLPETFAELNMEVMRFVTAPMREGRRG